MPRSEVNGSAHAASGGSEWAWVLGTGRCGSTLVHEVLARHPGVGFISNLEDRASWLEWTGRWSSSVYRFVPERLTAKGRVRYAPSEGYRLLARRVSPSLCDPSRDLVAADATPWMAERLHDVFEARAREQGRPLFLHKFTGWPRVGLLDAAFPGSRYVHVVRDGRAVANSWLQMPWYDGHRGPDEWLFGPLPPAYREEWEASGRSFVVLAGLAWKMLVDAFETARRAVGAERWLELRYEDVLADPGATFARALEFLGLDWEPRFAQALARYRFHGERSQAFRRDLGPEAVALLDASLGDHLTRFGYS
jgi:hypothetical protein